MNNPIEMHWSIFFLVALAGATCTAALPVEAWGIFFLSGLAVRVSGGLVDRVQDAADMRNYNEVKGFFRVEATILRLVNDAGVEHNGLPCDGPLGKCDPRVSAFIDT
jgi:hypothetical protein